MLGRPAEECPTRDLQGSGAFYFYKDVGGSSVKIRPLENYVVTVKTD